MATKRVRANFLTKKDGIQNTTAVDRISKLPDHLIHRILSFVPTIDVVRMSILSRHWRRVWYSVPSLHLCHTDHMDRFHFHSQPEQAFYKFVNKCLKHRERSARYITDSSISSLKLHIEYYRDNPALDNLSTFAIWRNIEELDLCTEPRYLYYRNCYCLPEVVLNARSLTVLKLGHLIIEGSCSISLPSVTFLSLAYVKLRDKTLYNLLLGCSAIEKFVLTRCYELSDPKISSLRLKFLEIEDDKAFETLEIEAINLESFKYDGNCEDINLSACKAIRSLSLLDIMLDDESMEDLICGFPLLESLTLYHSLNVEHIRICGQHLKNIRLDKYYEPAQKYLEITIEAPNLVSFHYKGNIKRAISIKGLDTILNGHIVIKGPYPGQEDYYDRDWYINLIRFLLKINFYWNTTVSLHVYSEEALIFPENLRKFFHSLWSNLKHLKVMTFCDLKKIPELRDALYWISPSLETLVIKKKTKGYY
ncbi:F-box domain containing protein [Trema orientale]|uniref:F-box domain containing protein n=1 Tax=Trema orientale TaxID=63057 RepID=A0A2P5D0M8_TREOI|nr:F-box domain containing protein [Trema orientale]